MRIPLGAYLDNVNLPFFSSTVLLRFYLGFKHSSVEKTPVEASRRPRLTVSQLPFLAESRFDNASEQEPQKISIQRPPLDWAIDFAVYRDIPLNYILNYQAFTELSPKKPLSPFIPPIVLSAISFIIVYQFSLLFYQCSSI